MSKFNSIEISNLVALHPKVEVHKFLGLFERVSYQPTHSLIESYQNYYDAPDADVLQKIAEGDDPKETLEAAMEMNTVQTGDYRLDLCISKDRMFAAFQVFERQSDKFVPYSKLCFLEGDSANMFENLLA